MKIIDLKNEQAVQFVNQGNKGAPAEKTRAAAEGAKTPAAADRVEISSRSRDLNRIHEVLARTPDIRSEKVEALKKAVAEGKYQVSAENLAAKMIREILAESGKE